MSERAGLPKSFDDDRAREHDDVACGEADEAPGRIARALKIAADFGTEDGDHHKMWVIDQMVRELTGCPVVERVSRFPDVHGNPYTYQGLGESEEYRAFVADGGWDEGIAP